MMIPTKSYMEPNQEKRITPAYRKKKGCQIKARKQANGPYHGEMLLTPEQWLKYQKLANGKTINLPFKHGHLVKNMKHKGGFLPLIAAALAPITSGVAGGFIEREIAGKGIYKKRSSKKKTIKKNTSSGLYLNPYMARER